MHVIIQTNLAQHEPHRLMVDATACRAAFSSLFSGARFSCVVTAQHARGIPTIVG
jgi:hypothetical protein